MSGITVDHPVDTLFEEFDVEVDQETKAAVGEFEVAPKLGFVERENDLDHFVFDDDGIIHDDVHAEGIVEGDAVINDRLSLLAHPFQTCFGDFVAETGFINAFDQPGSEVTMHGYRRADDFRGEFVLVRCGFEEGHVRAWCVSVLPQRGKGAEEQ